MLNRGETQLKASFFDQKNHLRNKVSIHKDAPSSGTLLTSYPGEL